MEKTLSSNNEIAGIKIASSSIKVVGGSIIENKTNLALILGITIPGAFLSNFYVKLSHFWSDFVHLLQKEKTVGID